jgi:hypothetical protein
MNLKNHNRVVFEAASQKAKSSDIELLGPPENQPSLVSTFGYDCQFFYFATKTTLDNQLLIQEYGIGYLYSEDNKVFLKRNLPLFYSTPSLPSPARCDNGPIDVMVDNSNSKLTVLCTSPLSYLENYYTDHCVLASSHPFTPQPVVVETNSLLGRLENNVDSLSFKKLCENKEFISEVMLLISKYSKQLSLKTSKLDIKKLSSNILNLNKSSKHNAKTGDIIYDEADSNIKYYDGSNWRTLLYKDDEAL